MGLVFLENICELHFNPGGRIKVVSNTVRRGSNMGQCAGASQPVLPSEPTRGSLAAVFSAGYLWPEGCIIMTHFRGEKKAVHRLELIFNWTEADSVTNNSFLGMYQMNSFFFIMGFPISSRWMYV